MMDPDTMNAARDALRAAMKARGHRPERQAKETFGQGFDTVSLWCPRCGVTGCAAIDEDAETVTIDGRALGRCHWEA